MAQDVALLGRYYVLEKLGEGGAGVVHAVYDRVLERKVALKHLRRGGEERLLREAQAMARLKHHGVVTVFDVGLLDGRGYVTMELVDGVSLRAWLAERARPWREILDLYLQAGQGLAAAHAAGLVHRDFKPDNVLVSRDGTARVADFGLARLAGEEAEGAPDLDASPALAAMLTHTGTVVGTPRYMAPEQARGEAADARSDQYSFCVSLWEGIAGTLPPAGGDALPSWVRAALARGLAEDGAARWPDMEALLDRLRRDPGETRKRWLLGGATAAALAAAAALFWPHRVDVCAGVDAPVRAVWSDARRAALKQGFVKTGVGYGGTLADWTTARLDAYAGDLSGRMRASCQATEVRHEQAPAVAARRGRCLADRLVELGAALSVLESLDAASLDRSSSVVGGLGQVAACADVRLLLDEDPPPTDPAAAALAEAVKREAARGSMLHRAGRLKESIELLSRQRELARPLASRPLDADVLRRLAVAQLETDPKGAEASALAAYAAALGGRVDRIAARAAIDLVHLTGRLDQRWDEAERWGRIAGAHVHVAGDDPRLTGELELALLKVAYARGKLDEAERHATRAEELYRAAGVDEVERAEQAAAAAAIFYSRGDDARAEAEYQRALAGFRSSFGDANPRVAVTMGGLAQTYVTRKRYPEAIALLERAVAIHGELYGDKVVATRAPLLRSLADAYHESGRLADARRTYQRALEIALATLGPRHRVVIPIRAGLAYVRGEEGDPAGAAADLQQLIRDAEELEGKDHFQHYNLYLQLEKNLARAGRLEAAVAAAERALEIARVEKAADSVQDTEKLVAEARAALAAARAGRRRPAP